MKKKAKAFIPFSIIQLIIGYGICVTILIDPAMGLGFQHFARTTAPFQFLYGPLFYFYWVSMFRPNTRFRWVNFLHFIPFLLSLINYIPFYALSAEEKLILVKMRTTDNYTLFHFKHEFFVKFILFIIYSIAAILPFRQSIYTTLKHGSKRNKFIAKWMIIDLLLKNLSWIAIFFNEIFFIGEQYINPAYLLYSSDSIMNVFIIHIYPFVLIGFRGSAHKPIITKNIPISNPASYSITEKEKEFLYKLNDLLEVGQLFTDEDLSAHQLAKKLYTSEVYLSDVIYKNFQLSTEELIDLYRVNFLLNMEKENIQFKNMSKEKRAECCGFKTQIAMETALYKFTSLKN